MTKTTPPEGGFGIYIHWPFCQAKCPYCDFNSHVSASVDHDAWRAALLADLDAQIAWIGKRDLQSIFFGGGTPSLMEPKTVDALLNHIHKNFSVASDLEVTFEANPTSVEAEKFADFRKAGVNRVSVGVQSLRDDDLRALGRLHSADEAKQAIEIAQKHFERMSFDLIYARQHQTAKAWEDELKEAIALAADHLSLYQLTIEDGTAFGARYAAGKLDGLPDDNLSADLYDLTHQICNDAGLHRYEVSNYAKEGCESRHNLIYWRYGDYLGIGPGAHGRVTINGQKYATITPLAPQDYLDAVKSGKTDWRDEDLSNRDIFIETALMGLRLREGIELNRLDGLGESLNETAISDYVAEGILQRTGNRLSVTQNNFIILNQILRDIL